MHIYDRRYSAVAGARLLPPDAPLARYLALRHALGLQRTVCVTPSTYGTDYRGMLAAVAEMGGCARGVAVVDACVSDGDLRRLHTLGVRGIRLNLSMAVSATPAMLRPLAERIAPLGWHVQLIVPADRLGALAPDLDALPVDFVLDHFAKIGPSSLGSEAHRRTLRWLEHGRGWVKLSGAYLVSEAGHHDGRDAGALARSFLGAAPERLVWGTNWPHATASAGMHPWPDDAALLGLLEQWCRDAATLRRVLVDNPARLYDFSE
jgi:predicted TIM-barrel fold metal-dependent hydrolase